MSKLLVDAVSGVCPGTETGTVVPFPAAESVKAEKAGRAEAPSRSRGGGREAGREPGRGLVLNKQTVRKLACEPGKAETLYRDSQLSGFILRCYANGRRMWLVQYRDGTGATRRVNIGDATLIEADVARGRARELLAEARLGKGPAEKREAARAALKFADVMVDYLVFAEGRQKPRSYAETARNLTTCIRMGAGGFGREPIRSIGRVDIAEVHTRLTAERGAVAANRALAALSAMFSWAMGRGIVEMNPVIKIPRNAERSRERVLSDAELRKIWAATSDRGDFSAIVRLLMLTGCRRGEVSDMRWEEIADIDGRTIWTIPAARSKNGLPHEVPLSAEAIGQLPGKSVDARAFVFGRREASGFSGWSQAKARLDRQLVAAGWSGGDWSLHDLRRSFSTKLHEELRIEPHVVEALLGHVSGHRAGVAGTYNRALYRAQKTEALEAWARHLGRIVSHG